MVDIRLRRANRLGLMRFARRIYGTVMLTRASVPSVHVMTAAT